MALAHRASWGYVDPGPGVHGKGARSTYHDGVPNVPVHWGLTTERKRACFDRVRQITGGEEPAPASEVA